MQIIRREVAVNDPAAHEAASSPVVDHSLTDHGCGPVMENIVLSGLFFMKRPAVLEIIFTVSTCPSELINAEPGAYWISIARAETKV